VRRCPSSDTKVHFTVPIPATSRPDAMPPRQRGAEGARMGPTKSEAYPLIEQVAPVSQITEKVS
jgi:hypothetical protein